MLLLRREEVWAPPTRVSSLLSASTISFMIRILASAAMKDAASVFPIIIPSWLLLISPEASGGGCTKRELIQVDVAPGQDNPHFLGFEHKPVAEYGGQSYCCRGLGNDFHPFPYQTHGLNDVFLGGGEDVVQVIADDAEGEGAQRGEQPVGDGVGSVDRNEEALLEGAVGVIGHLGLGGIDADILFHIAGGYGRSTGEAPAAYRRDDGIQVGHLLEQLFGCCALPAYHVEIG